MSALGNLARQLTITDLAALTGLQIDIGTTATNEAITGIPTDVSYAAQSITLSDAGDGQRMNHTLVSFPVMAANFTATAWAIRRTSDLGILWFGDFTSGQVITAGDAFGIAANALRLTFNPGG